MRGGEPANAKNLHRKLTAADDLEEILAWREETPNPPRVASQNRFAGRSVGS
jgi:hypothetical protein